MFLFRILRGTHGLVILGVHFHASPLPKGVAALRTRKKRVASRYPLSFFSHRRLLLKSC